MNAIRNIFTKESIASFNGRSRLGLLCDSLDFVSRETIQKLKTYETLLKKWQKTINLVSCGTLNDIWGRHISDSLQMVSVLEWIRSKQEKKHIRILDVGSGGGFPGMVLSITGYDVTCIDSDQRKMLFLSEIARQTSSDTTIVCDRIENFKRSDFDIVTARGFSSLSVLLSIMINNTQNGIGVFLKGKNVEDEINEAKLKYNFNCTLVQSETDENGRIIIVDNVIELLRK